MEWFFGSAESPRRAHPDRFANTIVEDVLSHVLEIYPAARADINAVVGYDRKEGKDSVYLSGNVSSVPGLSKGALDELAHASVRRLALAVGYSRDSGFDPHDFLLDSSALNPQSEALEANGRRSGVGDSRVVAGYAEAAGFPGRLPGAVVIAEDVSAELDRANGRIPSLLPDGKVQVSLIGERTLVTISAQHERGADLGVLRDRIVGYAVVPAVSGARRDPEKLEVRINNGRDPFVDGGPRVDSGVSNVKRCVYGECLPHYGGGPYGKDVTKPEVFALYKARELANRGLRNGAHACFVQLAYSIGNAEPVVAVGIKRHDDRGLWVSVGGLKTGWGRAGYSISGEELEPLSIIRDLGLTNQEVVVRLASGDVLGRGGSPGRLWEAV